MSLALIGTREPHMVTVLTNYQVWIFTGFDIGRPLPTKISATSDDFKAKNIFSNTFEEGR